MFVGSPVSCLARNLYFNFPTSTMRAFVRCSTMSNCLRLLVSVFFWFAITSGVASQESILAFTHVNVIDAAGAPVQVDMTVIDQGNYIKQIGKSDDTAAPSRSVSVEGH